VYLLRLLVGHADLGHWNADPRVRRGDIPKLLWIVGAVEYPGHVRRDRLTGKPLSKRFRHPKGEPGFRDGRFHSFRHFFVSQCFVQGVDEGTIRSWLGHSDSRILELYRHLAEKDSQRLMQKLDFSGKAKDARRRTGIYLFLFFNIGGVCVETERPASGRKHPSSEATGTSFCPSFVPVESSPKSIVQRLRENTAFLQQ
jgi:hypothetical protein